MDKLIFENISFSWSEIPQSDELFNNISFRIKTGEFISFVGPSGCGKTTLLNLVAGIVKPTNGKILYDGQLFERKKDAFGFVFQDYSLFPWLNVMRNVDFGLRIKKMDKEFIQKQTEKVLRYVGLWDARNKYPHQLSGGMMQRTAIARVIANDSDYLLMDEPFGSLDYQTRLKMQNFIIDIWKQFNKTVLFVTHNIEEAIILSDRVFLVSVDPNKPLKELTIKMDRPRDTSNKQYSDYFKIIINHLENEG